MKANPSLSWMMMLSFSVLLSGCLGKVRMQYGPLEEARSSHGEIVMGAINNLRIKKGGTSFAYLGTIRGGYGNPFAIVAEPSRELDVVLRELFTDVLRHSGYAVSTMQLGSDVPILEVDVVHFWCDGYVGYEVSSDLRVRLLSPDGASVLIQRRFESTRGFALFLSYGPLHRAYDRIMNDIAQRATAWIQSPEFESAYRGSSAGAPGPGLDSLRRNGLSPGDQSDPTRLSSFINACASCSG